MQAFAAPLYYKSKAAQLRPPVQVEQGGAPCSKGVARQACALRSLRGGGCCRCSAQCRLLAKGSTRGAGIQGLQRRDSSGGVFYDALPEPNMNPHFRHWVLIPKCSPLC